MMQVFHFFTKMPEGGGPRTIRPVTIGIKRDEKTVLISAATCSLADQFTRKIGRLKCQARQLSVDKKIVMSVEEFNKRFVRNDKINIEPLAIELTTTPHIDRVAKK